MRTLPAAWQTAADAAHVLRTYDQRVLLQIQVATSPVKHLWLSFVDVDEDPDGLGVWQAAGAWPAPDNVGPLPLLRTLPDLKNHSDLVSLVSLSAHLGDAELSNTRDAELFAALGQYRLCELRFGGYSLNATAAWVHAQWTGVAWADRLTWKLRTVAVERYDETRLWLSLSDVIGEANDQVNARMTAAAYPGLPLRYVSSPKPIVLGGGSAIAREARSTVDFTDREGRAAAGGYVTSLKPGSGAPWTAGDRVTLGSGTQTVASVAGSTDTTTTLTLTAPGLARDPLHGEADLDTQEVGYHATSYPTDASMPLVWADPDFAPPTPATSEVKMLAADGKSLLPLPSYCGTPTFPAAGEVSLPKRPRLSPSQFAQVVVDAASAGSITAETAFNAFCSSKLALAASEYAVDLQGWAASTQPLQGGRMEAMSRVEFLRALELCTFSRCFWDGEKFKFRRRKRSSEIGAGSFNAFVDVLGHLGPDRYDILERLPPVMPLPESYRSRGFIARWDRDPALPSGSAASYRKTREKGSNASGREEQFWWDFLVDQATGDEVADAWYDLLGPMVNGSWPRYLIGLAVDWSYMKLEPEDIVRLYVNDGNGDSFDQLGYPTYTINWRVVSKDVRWPQGGRPGIVYLTLLEVHT